VENSLLLFDQGVTFPVRYQKAEARRRRAEGATLAEFARSCDLGKSTISRLASGRPQ